MCVRYMFSHVCTMSPILYFAVAVVVVVVVVVYSDMSCEVMEGFCVEVCEQGKQNMFRSK